MTNSNLGKVCCIVLFLCFAVSAQQTGASPPPPAPQSDRSAAAAVESDAGPRTFIERTSPATFGATVITGAGDRLVVGDVKDGSPAGAAGFASGDMIVSIDGQFITEPDEFNSYLASHPADRLRIVVMRDGAEQTLIVNDAANTSEVTDARPALGVRFLQANQVVLHEVIPGSPAERAGLRPGDHLIALNDTPIASTDHFINLVASAPLDAALELVVLRGRDRQAVSVTPAPWDAVFDRESRDTTLRPVTSDAMAIVPAMNYVGPVYYRARVSPVGVPAIAFPTYYGFSYGSTSWVLPDSPYDGGVSVHPNWSLYTGPACDGPESGDPGP